MHELKNCPFCRDGASYVMGRGLPVTNAECANCEIRMFIGDWNTRPIEDALRAELATANARCAHWQEEHRKASIYAEEYHKGLVNVETRCAALERVVRELVGYWRAWEVSGSRDLAERFREKTRETMSRAESLLAKLDAPTTEGE